MAFPNDSKIYEGKDLEAMSFANNYHRWILGEFADFLGDNVAEVGSGSGNFSSLLLERNIKQLIAIEPADEMSALLVNKFGGDKRLMVNRSLFSDVYEKYNNYFDSIVYVNVLEHVKDDFQELKYVYQSLHRDGYVCIFVPAFKFLYSEFDASVGHYRRYAKQQLVNLLAESGFEVVKVKYFDILGIIPWLLFFKILRRKKLTSNGVVLYDRWLVPVLRRIESIIPMPWGKNLLVVGRKIND